MLTPPLSGSSHRIPVGRRCFWAARVLGALIAITSFSATAAVKLSVSPASASLTASQTQQFKAKVTGISNTQVTWSLNPAVGAISSTGLYTAPTSVASAQTITVTAISAASPTTAATASLNLTPPTVSITAAPNTPSLPAPHPHHPPPPLSTTTTHT